MRRTAAALATAVLTAATLTPSLAGAQTPEGLRQISCGTLGDPVCPIVDQVVALAAPLRPVLDLAGPALGDLGAAANHLTAILEAGPELPPEDVASAAGALLHQLDLLAGGLVDLLAGAGVEVAPLKSALSQLQKLAQAPLSPAAGPAAGHAAAQASPAPARPAAGPTQTSASSSGPTGFSSPLSSGSAPVSSPAVPDVPVGGTLQLGPLTLPPFSFNTTPATTAEQLVAERAATELIAPAVSAALAPVEDDRSSRTTAIVLAMSLLMLAVGLVLDQAHKVQQPIRL